LNRLPRFASPMETEPIFCRSWLSACSNSSELSTGTRVGSGFAKRDGGSSASLGCLGRAKCMRAMRAMGAGALSAREATPTTARVPPTPSPRSSGAIPARDRTLERAQSDCHFLTAWSLKA
jgi:hypothetical protein